MPERWQGWALTGEALLELLTARLIIHFIPVRRWDPIFGRSGADSPQQIAFARRIARHVLRAAGRLPIESKCLPQAMAFSRMLRRRGIAHRLVIAARPAGLRSGTDDLHAWIEVGDAVIMGELPGAWAVIHHWPEKLNQL